MASTSTNKQPLLIDRPLHIVKDLTTRFVDVDVSIDPGAGNRGLLMLDCTQNDGAVIESVYTYSRKPQAPATLGYVVNLYMCPNNTVMDPASAFLVGNFVASEDEGKRRIWMNAPEVNAPVARLGSEDDTDVIPTHFRALYIPKGQCLYAAVQKQTADDPCIYTPILGIQGGYY